MVAQALYDCVANGLLNHATIPVPHGIIVCMISYIAFFDGAIFVTPFQPDQYAVSLTIHAEGACHVNLSMDVPFTATSPSVYEFVESRSDGLIADCTGVPAV
jgi:hypothetical protein